MNTTSQQPPCPCGSGQLLSNCCGPLLAYPESSAAAAQTPEQLMRSRYSAFVLQRRSYLLATWHPDTRPAELDLAADAPDQWLGLTVKAATQDGDHGTVTFVARWKIGGRASRLTETSRFVRQDGRWYYRDGDTEIR